MSLWCIRHPSLPVSIPDELESYFHVLLYNAVRFLPHNLTDVHSFVSHYFDNAVVVNGTQVASADKSHAIQYGNVTFADEKLRFKMPANDDTGEHPMNQLIRNLLKLFGARYRVLKWEATQAAQATTLPPVPSSWDVNRPVDLDDDIQETPFTARLSKEILASGITAEDLELAESLKTHQAVIDIFAQIVQKARWPASYEKDVMGDRLFGYRQASRVNPSTRDKVPKQAKTAPAGGPSARVAKAGRASTKAKMDALSE